MLIQTSFDELYQPKFQKILFKFNLLIVTFLTKDEANAFG